jgi:SHS family sialic acid transporter-like MFS transporter
MNRPTESISRGAWLALVAAFLGWMFDGFEMGLFPLIGRPAMLDLLGRGDPNLDPALLSQNVNLWLGIMTAVFLVGAATGGVVFGWLGDRIGRVRAMTLSVLTYTVFMGLCGLSTSPSMMAVLRFIASLGMGGEWSLGVALVMESWPNRSRAFLAGLIGAASNVGFLSVALVGLALSRVIHAAEASLTYLGLPESMVRYLVFDAQGEATGWRLMMILGAVPALLTFFIRMMVPESERWLENESRGATSHWATRDMLGVVVGSLGSLLIIWLWAQDQGALGMGTRIAGSVAGFLVALGGFLYPVLRYLQRSEQGTQDVELRRTTIYRMVLGAALSGVALIGTWATIQNAPHWADHLVEVDLRDAAPEIRTAKRSEARSTTQICSAMGAIVGTIAAALLGDLLGRRPAYALLCVASLASTLAFFQWNQHYGTQFLLMVFVAGGVTASFYGWLPLYLPELFRTQVRATGQGFSFNFGRILAAIGALQFGYLMKSVFDGDYVKTCSTLSLVYVVGVVIVWLVPETKGQPLPD